MGDTFAKIINEETWKWVVVKTKNVSEEQLTKIINDSLETEDRETYRKEINSKVDQNDRALTCSPDVGETFFSLSKAMKFIKKQKIEIEDIFEGENY